MLATIAAGFNFLTSVEQAISAPLGAIPFPGFPALRIGDIGIGYPHAHAHPPNLIPPAPPVPFPHALTLIPIPIFSGAARVTVAGAPGARCGDFGVLIWCGGYFPLCEVFLGSATVWVEGSRAGRVLVDITKHCIFSSPKPSDPPMGPMVGTTMSAAANVLIGGVPMPSLTSMAIAAAFKAVFKLLGRLGRTIGARLRLAERAERRAAAHIDDLVARNRIILHGDDAFQRAARRDLEMLARTRTGRKILDDIAGAGRHVEIRSPTHLPPGSGPYRGPFASAMDFPASGLDIVPNPHGPFQRIDFVWDGANNRWVRNAGAPVHVRGTGAGSSSHIVYDPTRAHPNHAVSRGTPSDVILAHEMNHARNNALGRRANEIALDQPGWTNRWQDLEEFDTVAAENAYRGERGGVPLRPDYSVLP